MRALIAAAVALAACGPKARLMLPSDAPVPWQTSGIDWTRSPALAPAAPFRPPAQHAFTLANGTRVIVVSTPRVPLVAIDCVHADAGSRFDGDKQGVAGLTAELLQEGAGSRTGPALRAALAQAGARLDIHTATEHASMSVVTSRWHVADALALLADMSRAPRFDEADVMRVRGQRVAELEQHLQRPRTIAAQVFDRVVFGAHPYALPTEGTVASVRAVSRDDVRAFWTRAYHPGALTVLVVGDVTPERGRELVERAFGSWRDTAAPLVPPPPLAAFAPQLALVDTPGATQSVLLIGRRAAAAGDPQQLAGEVANSIVGGGIGARLDHELHDTLALTIGASASFWRGRLAGSWGIATTFARDKTLTGIRAALDILDQMRSADVGADELARAKTNLLEGARQLFDSDLGIARALERLVAQGLPLDWYATYERRIDAITAADVRAVAATWQALAIVIVGDRTVLEPQLASLGLPIQHYAADGTPRP